MGINPSRICQKYLVLMSFNNKNRSFGVYNTIEEAKKVRKGLEQKRYAGYLV